MNKILEHFDKLHQTEPNSNIVMGLMTVYIVASMTKAVTEHNAIYLVTTMIGLVFFTIATPLYPKIKNVFSRSILKN